MLRPSVAILLLLMAEAYASGTCGFVELPAINDSLPCPRSKIFWDGELARRKLRSMAPGCEHEVAVQFLWSAIPRSKFSRKGNNSSIRALGSYHAHIFHAAPHAIVPQVHTSELRSISVSVPGNHFFIERQTEAEIRFHHRGNLDFDVVFPLTTGNSSDLITWFLKEVPKEKICSWNYWFLHWFHCPEIIRGPHLSLDKLLSGKDIAWHYRSDACIETFVLKHPLDVGKDQLRQFVSADHDDPIASQSKVHPKGVSASLVLLPTKTFSVFDAHELLTRRVQYGAIFGGGALVLVAMFLYVRFNAKDTADYEQLSAEAAQDWLKQRGLVGALVVDHWLSYIVAIALPVTAYRCGYINRRFGSPWEFHCIYAIWLFGHGCHELYWFRRVGPPAAKVSYSKVAKTSITGPLSELDFYLDTQFICIALQWGSKLAYWSLGVFIFSNIVCQLLLQTIFSLEKTIKEDVLSGQFKCRGFDVMHEVVCHWEKKHKKPNCSAFAMGVKVFLEDVLQAIIQILFTLWFGGSPIVYFSVAVSTGLAFLGFVTEFNRDHSK